MSEADTSNINPSQEVVYFSLFDELNALTGPLGQIETLYESTNSQGVIPWEMITSQLEKQFPIELFSTLEKNSKIDTGCLLDMVYWVYNHPDADYFPLKFELNGLSRKFSSSVIYNIGVNLLENLNRGTAIVCTLEEGKTDEGVFVQRRQYTFFHRQEQRHAYKVVPFLRISTERTGTIYTNKQITHLEADYFEQVPGVINATDIMIGINASE